MKIKILGSGDTMGTPRLWCTCPTCQWARKHNFRRTRFSILIDDSYLIDVSPDIKYQLEKCGPKKIRAIFITHAHFDHVGGLPELYRVIKPMIYATPNTISYLKTIYHYLPYSYTPIRPYVEFYVDSFKITPFLVDHPSPTQTVGYLFVKDHKRIAITSDTRKNIPQKSLDLMMNVDLLITDAFTTFQRKIPKHMNLYDARELARKINAKRVLFVHASHLMPPPYILKKIAPEIPTDGYEIVI